MTKSRKSLDILSYFPKYVYIDNNYLLEYINIINFLIMMIRLRYENWLYNKF